MRKQILLIVALVTVFFVAIVSVILILRYTSVVTQEYTAQAELIYSSIDGERVKERLYRIKKLALLKSYGISLEVHLHNTSTTYTTLKDNLYTYHRNGISIVMNISSFLKRINRHRIAVIILGLSACALIIGILYILLTVFLVNPVQKVIHSVASSIPKNEKIKGKNEVETLGLCIQSMLEYIRQYFKGLDAYIAVIIHTNTILMAAIPEKEKGLTNIVITEKNMKMDLQEFIPIIQYASDRINTEDGLLSKAKERVDTLIKIEKEERDAWKSCRKFIENIDAYIHNQVSLHAKLSKVLDKLHISAQKHVEERSNISHTIKPCLVGVDNIYTKIQEINLLAMNTIIGISQGSKKGNDIILIAENIRDVTEKVLNDIEDTSNNIKKISSIGMTSNKSDSNLVHLLNEFQESFNKANKNSKFLSSDFGKYLRSYGEHASNERNIFRCNKAVAQLVEKLTTTHSDIQKNMDYCIKQAKRLENKLQEIVDETYHTQELTRKSNERVSILDEQLKNIITESNVIWSKMNHGSSADDRLETIEKYIMNLMAEEEVKNNDKGADNGVYYWQNEGANAERVDGHISHEDAHRGETVLDIVDDKV